MVVELTESYNHPITRPTEALRSTKFRSSEQLGLNVQLWQFRKYFSACWRYLSTQNCVIWLLPLPPRYWRLSSLVEVLLDSEFPRRRWWLSHVRNMELKFVFRDGSCVSLALNTSPSAGPLILLSFLFEESSKYVIISISMTATSESSDKGHIMTEELSLPCSRYIVADQWVNQWDQTRHQFWRNWIIEEFWAMYMRRFKRVGTVSLK